MPGLRRLSAIALGVVLAAVPALATTVPAAAAAESVARSFPA